MSNCCSTDIQIRGKKEELAIFWKKFNEAININSSKRDDVWLGNILVLLKREDLKERGIDPDGPESPIRDELARRDWLNTQARCCRGSVVYAEISADGEQIDIAQDDAWGPQLDPVCEMVERYAPNADIVYTAIEPGCEVFITSDPEKAGQWLIDVQDPDGLPDCIKDLDWSLIDDKKAREIAFEALGILPNEYTQTRSLMEVLDAKFTDNISVHQMEYDQYFW